MVWLYGEGEGNSVPCQRERLLEKREKGLLQVLDREKICAGKQ